MRRGSLVPKHEYHLKLGLTERPMEVLMGDVHHVNLTIAQALASDHAELRHAGFSAVLAGDRKIKAFLNRAGSCG